MDNGVGFVLESGVCMFVLRDAILALVNNVSLIFLLCPDPVYVVPGCDVVWTYTRMDCDSSLGVTWNVGLVIPCDEIVINGCAVV